MGKTKVKIAQCVKCHCTDDRACIGGCEWAQFNREAGQGVCSSCIRDATVTRTIEFEDGGQDFTEFDLDATGMVVDVRPCQAWLWQGRFVSNPAAKNGELIVLVSPGEKHGMQLRYPVLKNSKVKAQP